MSAKAAISMPGTQNREQNFKNKKISAQQTNLGLYQRLWLLSISESENQCVTLLVLRPEGSSASVYPPSKFSKSTTPGHCRFFFP